MKNETAKCFYYNLHSLSLSPISFSCFLDLPVALVSYFYYVLFFLNLCQANCAAFSALLAAAAAAADEFHYETNKSSHANATRRCCRRRLSDCTASCSFKSHFMHLLSMLNFVCACVCVWRVNTIRVEQKLFGQDYESTGSSIYLKRPHCVLVISPEHSMACRTRYARSQNTLPLAND